MEQPQPNYPKFDAQYQYQDDTADLQKPLSVGQFMITMFLLVIPVVDIIMLFIWAFSRNTNANRKNYARAILIYTLILVIISIIAYAIFGDLLLQTITNTIR